MPPAFICRRCIARLSKSAIGTFRSQRAELHSNAIPAPPGQPPVAAARAFDRSSEPSTGHLGWDRRSPPAPASFGTQVPERANNARVRGSIAERLNHRDSDELWDSLETEVSEHAVADQEAMVLERSEEPMDVELFEQTVPDHDAQTAWHKILNGVLASPTPGETGGSDKYRKRVDRAELQLRHIVLLAEAHPTSLLRHFMLSHAMPRVRAVYTVHQLKRLLQSCLLNETTDLLHRYHAWKSEFELLLGKSDRRTPPGATAAEKPTADAWALLEDEEAFKATWQRLDKSRRQNAWPRMVLSALTLGPDAVLALLRATFDPVWCPNYIIEDIINYHFLRNKPYNTNGGKDRDFARLALYMLEAYPPGRIVLVPAVLTRVAGALSTRQLVEYHELLKAIQHPLTPDTLLRFADIFARWPDGKVRAAEIICTLTERPGFDINSLSCASVCTTLLTLGKHDVQPEGDAAPDELFKSLMEHGFQPDLVHLTALMRNFCVRGDLATAWKVLEIMVQHNIDPDARALSILLNRSKLDRDFESFEKVVDLIQAQGSWSRELLHDCLDTLFRDNEKQDERRRRQRKGTHDAWQPMLELYAKFFDLAPLQKFTLFPLQSLLAPETRPSRHVSRVTELLKAVSPKEGHEPIQPDSITLCLMIATHMRSIDSEATLLKYWTHFANLLRERDPHIMTILEQQLTWLHDIFLRAFSQYRGLLTYSVKFVDHMLRRAREEERQLGRNVLHHPPSVHTWTILLNAFKNHHYPTGSVAVLELMVRNDQTQPNLVSWNALIMAFARTRNVKAAVESMHYLEQAGLVSDEHTVAAFQRFPMAQREEAIRLLERARRGGTVNVNSSTTTSSSTSSSSALDNNQRSSGADGQFSFSGEVGWRTHRALLRKRIRPHRVASLGLFQSFEELTHTQHEWEQFQAARQQQQQQEEAEEEEEEEEDEQEQNAADAEEEEVAG